MRRGLLIAMTILCLAPSCASAQWYLFPGTKSRPDSSTVTVSEPRQQPAETQPLPEGTEADEPRDSSRFSIFDLFDIFTPDIPERVALTLLLPFNTGGTVNANMMDFYSGALLAVRDLGNEGVKIDLNSVDETVKRSIFSNPFIQSDVVIGPVSTDDLRQELHHCPAGKYLISPLEPKAAALADSARVIQAPAPWECQASESIRWLQEEFTPSDKLVLVVEKNVELNESGRYLKALLDESGIPYATIAYGILQGMSIASSFTASSTRTGTTRFVIASDNEAFVGDAIRNIGMLKHRNLDVAVYSTSKIRSFSTIETEDLHNVNLRVAASYYIDYTDPAVKQFILAYRALFHTEPGAFAFSGYDTTRYFVDICTKYGRMWPMKLEEYGGRGLQSSFRFRNIPGAGFVNQAVRRIIYAPDYTITVVN